MKSYINKIIPILTDDLRRKPYKGNPNPLAGHCYIFCEVLYHLSNKFLKPCFIRHEDQSHWFLKDSNGFIIDPTASQFKTIPNYNNGIGKGFLTKNPSKRSKYILDKLNE